MNRHSCLNDIAALKEWFEMLKTPQWNLYRGFHNKMPVSAVYKQQNDQMGMEESWQTLQRMIEMQSGNGGQWTIYVPAYPGNKPAAVHLSLNMAPAISTAPGLGGIPSTGFGYVSGDEVERRIRDAEERWELKRQVEDLSNRLEQADSWQDIVMAKVMEIDPNTIVTKLGSILGQIMQPQGVQLRGLAHEMAAPAQSQAAHDQEGAVQYQYDGAWLIPVLDTMRVHFATDEEFKNAMERMAVKFSENPDMFKSLLNG